MDKTKSIFKTTTNNTINKSVGFNQTFSDTEIDNKYCPKQIYEIGLSNMNKN